MKAIDFSGDRAMANEKLQIAMQLTQDVKEYFKDVDDMGGKVDIENLRMTELDDKLDDLKQNSQDSIEKLRDAKMLNFQNSDPAVSFKATKIREQMMASEANNRLGNDLNREANGFLREARDAYTNINNKNEDMKTNRYHSYIA